MSELFVTMADGENVYYFLKVVRRGFDVYSIPPQAGLHHSVHESGEAHFRGDTPGENPPPVAVMTGSAGTINPDGSINIEPLDDLGRAEGLFTALFCIGELSSDYAIFSRKPKNCFTIERTLFSEDTELVEVGVWAVPKRNEISFDYNVQDIPKGCLFKLADEEPQIWVYARPL